MSRHLQSEYHQNELDYDSDEFEDVVMDRLSELENNINNLMQSKRAKEESRGIVGQPITKRTTPQSNTHKKPTKTFQQKVSTPNYWHNSRDPFSVKQRRSKFYGNLKHNNYDFQELPNRDDIHQVTFGPGSWQAHPQNHKGQPGKTIQKIRGMINDRPSLPRKRETKSEVELAREGYRSRQNSDR